MIWDEQELPILFWQTSTSCVEDLTLSMHLTTEEAYISYAPFCNWILRAMASQAVLQ